MIYWSGSKIFDWLEKKSMFSLFKNKLKVVIEKNVKREYLSSFSIKHFFLNSRNYFLRFWNNLFVLSVSFPLSLEIYLSLISSYFPSPFPPLRSASLPSIKKSDMISDDLKLLRVRYSGNIFSSCWILIHNIQTLYFPFDFFSLDAFFFEYFPFEKFKIRSLEQF